MMAAERAARIRSADEGWQPIECRGCGDLIAKRHSDGSLEVVVKGEHYSPDLRVQVKCPRCGTRARLRPRAE